MKDHEFTKGHKDWNAVLRTWIRNEEKFHPRPHPVYKPSQSSPCALPTLDQIRAERDDSAGLTSVREAMAALRFTFAPDEEDGRTAEEVTAAAEP